MYILYRYKDIYIRKEYVLYMLIGTLSRNIYIMYICYIHYKVGRSTLCTLYVNRYYVPK